MNQRRKYWISTIGKRPFAFALITKVPDSTLSIMYGLKECNWFTFFIFKKTKINLLVKDKFRWLRH